MQRLVVSDAEGVVRAIARGIDRALNSGMRVLWLLSGGSNIDTELAVLAQLRNATPENLTISLIDERFVPPGSKDSNWQQLIAAGLTDEKARLLPVVVDELTDVRAAAADFTERLTDVLEEATMVVGQFGIGTDGHTAGILPETPGVHEQEKLAIGYAGHDFIRITSTPALFARLNLAVAVAMGEQKRTVIEQLASDIDPAKQPAQLLKQAKEFILYTDQKVEWT